MVRRDKNTFKTIYLKEIELLYLGIFSLSVRKYTVLFWWPGHGHGCHTSKFYDKVFYVMARHC